MSNTNSPYLFSHHQVFEHEGEVLADPGVVQAMNPHKARGELHHMHDVTLYSERVTVETDVEDIPATPENIGKTSLLGAGGADWRKAASRVRRKGAF